MGWKCFLFLIAAVFGMTTGCDISSGHPNGPARATNMKALTSRVIKREMPNKLGFARISIRDGDVYHEGIVDSNQNEVISPASNILINDISGSLAIVQFERKFLFVPLDQGVITAEEMANVAGFQYAEPYQCGFALVVVNDRWFYINEKGEKAFEVDFDFAESFHHDRALVKVGEGYRIIDTHGTTVANLDYDQVSPQSPWCWQVTRIDNEKYRSGFIDLEGKEVTELIYDEVGYYDPKVKRIHVGKVEGKEIRFGFLDEFAQIAIPIQFEFAEVFDKGIARVTLEGRSFFIDPDGQEIMDR